MSVLDVRLLGKLDVRRDGQAVIDLQPTKAQELFAYLLLYRNRSHPREALANQMWRSNRAGQTRKYLRHALWQLQSALDSVDSDGRGGILLTDPDWIQLNPRAEVWLDVAELERAWALVQGIPGHELDRPRGEIAQQALELYRGDLLEGCYQDWCVFERERLQGLYLALLGKQMAFCEAHGAYEIGLACGIRALQCDVAHERIHRRMMRLRYLAGDRTGALRQYQRCVTFLRGELAVEPSARTKALYEQIRSGEPLTSPRLRPAPGPEVSDKRFLPSPETFKQLEQLHTALLALQGQLDEMMEMFQATLMRHD